MTQPIDLEAIEQRANAEDQPGYDGPAYDSADRLRIWMDKSVPPADRDRLIAEYREQVLTEVAEPLRVRLWLIEQYVARITADDDPVAIGLDLTPWLDGPLHPSHLAEYLAARTTQEN